ncbi:hypothetical protein GCM10009754_83550 [Amycolatopsis minnesotensis]|uniref:Uncharacterized protein n=1 Tax=Amycolatopsis minnesotensis TaxID=337894 RepID=A0ABP5EAC4_9PSEU
MVLHGFVSPRPAGTCRLIARAFVPLPPLCPGSSTTTGWFTAGTAEVGGGEGRAGGGEGTEDGEDGGGALFWLPPSSLPQPAISRAVIASTGTMRTANTVPHRLRLGWEARASDT